MRNKDIWIIAESKNKWYRMHVPYIKLDPDGSRTLNICYVGLLLDYRAPALLAELYISNLFDRKLC